VEKRNSNKEKHTNIKKNSSGENGVLHANISQHLETGQIISPTPSFSPLYFSFS
jgi:hypothetical protein